MAATGVPGLDVVLVRGGALTVLAGVGTGVWRVLRANERLVRLCPNPETSDQEPPSV
ncbi:hypothetical protein [Streptomyces corynorhini]|uniref:hypothetical protein n=1 Tax=Streptomyces corynorhini TaxID=2282652 RepID=UPI0013149FFF|nr:hypothetical protein [Streptomyces corynorhini]